MHRLLISLVLLGIAAVSAPAQTKVTRLDYGISYVIPRDYRPSPPERRTGALGEELISLEIKEGTDTQTIGENNQGYTNLSILSAIRVVSLRAEQNIRTGEAKQDAEVSLPDEAGARQIIAGLNSMAKLSGTTLDYQKSARIKVSGQNALAILCTGFSQRLNEAFTARLIFLPHKGKMYLFLFGALNAEFEEKVSAFNAFMNSFKFLTPPAPKKPQGKKK